MHRRSLLAETTGYFLVVVQGLCTVVASLVVELRSRPCGLQQFLHVGSVVEAHRHQRQVQ